MADMQWQKRGRVHVPDGSRWWARTHASFPSVDVRGDELRVYFTGMDEHSVGRTGFIDVSAADPTRVLRESAEPVLDVGALGTFDDCGANAFSIVTVDAQKYLYYQGWQRTERAPHLIFTGLATGDGQTFTKHSQAPILDRTPGDLFIRGAPFVVHEDGAFRMWYASARRWVQDEHGIHYELDIRHARSDDGVSWIADEEPCLSYAGDEYGVGRPCVVLVDGTYRMWFSSRSFSRPYRLGYAESHDGIHWTRMEPDSGLARSTDGWDSEMVCYGYVVHVENRLLMFYNGNRHGQSGFGLAEAEL